MAGTTMGDSNDSVTGAEINFDPSESGTLLTIATTNVVKYFC